MINIKAFRNSFFIYDIFGYFLPGFFFLCLIIIEYDITSILNFYWEHDTLEGLKEANLKFKFDYLFNFLTWNSDNDFKFTTLILLLFF
ncbi:MAG: hypothetical protein RIB86_23255, partial [Imperialibacter sp.]